MGIRETGGALAVTADMPKIPRENITTNPDRNMAGITGDARTSKMEKTAGYTRQERTYQRFYRALALPEEVLADKAEACADNGVLRLTLPEQAPTREPKKSKVPVK